MTAGPEPDAPRRLSSGEVLEYAAISERQLNHWVGQKYLRPEHEGGTGNGRRWPPEEAEIGRRMGLLVAAGIIPAAAADFARERWPSAEIAPGITVSVTG